MKDGNEKGGLKERESMRQSYAIHSKNCKIKLQNYVATESKERDNERENLDNYFINKKNKNNTNKTTIIKNSNIKNNNFVTYGGR